MEFSLLGALSVRADGKELGVKGSKPRALLGLLLANANVVVSADRLADDLWEGDPPGSAAGTLQSHISALRRVLGHDRLQTRGRGYLLEVADGELDATTFEAELAEAQELLEGSNPGGAVGRLTQALGRWHGPAFAEFATAAWAMAEASRLEEARLVAVETLLEARLSLGENAKAASEAEAAIRAHPLRERLWAHLIVALYRQGRQAEALRAYTRLRTTLADELGIDPSPDLQGLERAVLAQDPSLARPVRPARPSPVPHPASGALPTGLVTFLLTDIVGSTRMWDRARHAMPAALETHDALIRHAIEANGGFLLKPRGEGDSTLSVFRRATHAAAAALDAHEELRAAEWPEGCELTVRMALHTGESIERDGDYYGPTLNRAARLRGAAQAGQILVSHATADVVVDHLPPDARLVELGTQQLRDLDRPETVYLLTRSTTSMRVGHPASPVTRIPLPIRLASPIGVSFVGRAEELVQLNLRLKEASAGQRRVVLVAGEPGIGKSTLAAEAARAAYATGAVVLHGRCDEDLGVPYQPFAEAIGHLVEHSPATVIDRVGRQRMSDLARLVPTAAARTADAATPGTRDAETDRWLAFEAVTVLLAATSSDASVVLIVDDLQWADRGTLLLLRHIAGASQSMRLLVVGTYRDSELSADHPLATILADLRRESGIERIALSGLGDLDIIALIEANAGYTIDDRGVALAHAVRRETDGNPFFVWEIVRHLAETGAVAPKHGQWILSGELTELGLPDSVREVIGRRVGRLGSTTQRTLATAAVVGAEFDLDVVAAALGVADDEVLAALEGAENAALVLSVAPGRFSFAHALIQHTLYADLSPTRRAQAHRAVAEAIERLGQGDARVAELARHWAAATRPADSDLAVDYALRAGNQALRSLAPDDAVRWYHQALELHDQQSAPDPSRRCELLVRLGRAQRQAGDSAFRQTLLDAAKLAQQLGEAEQLVRAALANSPGIGAFAHVDPECIEALETALAAVGPDDSVVRARLLATLASQTILVNDLDTRRAMSDEAVEVARRLGDDRTLLQVLNLRYEAIWVPSTLDERLANTAEAMALAETLNDAVSLFWAASLRQRALLDAPDVAEVDRCGELMSKIAQELALPLLRGVDAMSRFEAALRASNFDEAERLYRERARLGDSMGIEEMAGTALGYEFSIRWAQGRAVEVIDALAPEGPQRANPGYMTAALALACLEGNRQQDARVFLDDALRTSTPAILPYQVGRLSTPMVWAEVCARIGDEQQIVTLYNLLAPFEQRVGGVYGMSMPVAHSLGILAARLGRLDEADRHFADAAALTQRIGDHFHIARTQLEWGRTLLARRDPGDFVRGTEMVEQALVIARRYGYGGVERSALVILASPAARPDPPNNLPTQLTSFVGRGVELAELVRLVRDDRLVTLTGPGGIGKTRLAIQAAAGMITDFPGGVWLVELAPLIDGALVGTAVASAIGAPSSPGVESTELVCRFLAQRQALVVMDNCEHVIDAASVVVDRLLAAAAGLRVLATSREPLGVAGESVWRVPSLCVEVEGNVGDAVVLFADRATHVHADFVLDQVTTSAAVAVCRRLDGIPLAIELAAARTKIMSVEQIASRLDERFRLLTRGSRTAVARQQTLQGAIDWSYELLTSTERELFDSLGVFAGDFTLVAAAAVAERDEFEALDLVQQLVDKSMLEVDPSRDRYRLLETLRQYAWDRLVATGRLAEARDAHAAWYLRVAGEQGARMSLSGQQVDALDRLEADYDNLRAALAHLIESRQADSAVRLARRLIGLFNIRHPREGLGWFQQILTVSDELPVRTRSRLLADAAFAAMNAGDQQAQTRFAEAAIVAGGSEAPALAHWLLSQSYSMTGEYYGPALEHARAAVAAAAASGDPTTHAIAAAQLIRVLAGLGEEAEVLELMPEAVRMAEDLGNPTITSSTYLSLGRALLALGQKAEAAAMLERALPDADAGGPLMAVQIRTDYAFLADDLDQAARVLLKAIPIARDQVSGYHQLYPLTPAARLLTEAGRTQLAARLLGAFRRNRANIGVDFLYLMLPSVEDRVLEDRLATSLAAEEQSEELERGALLDTVQALDLAEQEINAHFVTKQAPTSPQ